MLQIIAGKKGKGKTKILLEKVNEAVANVEGTIVYLDKSSKHMYELDNKVRLINITDYPVKCYEAFLGFVCGLISQDYDLQQIYFDSFLSIAFLELEDIEKAVSDLKKLSDEHNINFILSVSADASELPDSVKSNIMIAL